MKNQGNVTPPRGLSSTTELKDTEIGKLQGGIFKPWAIEMTQRAKCLLCKLNDLSLVTRTHKKDRIVL